MRVRVLGKIWKLRFAHGLSNRGDCDPPEKHGKEIRVSADLVGEERLEVVLHELVHAAGWHIDDPFAEQFARDAARIIWRLGHR